MMIVVTLVVILSIPGHPDIDGSRLMPDIDACFREARSIVDASAEMMRDGGNVSVMCDVKYPVSKEN